MKNLKDFRWIPTDPEIILDKRYFDTLYGYLQLQSTWDGEVQFIERDKINYSEIGKVLSFSRQTISKHINDFLEMGLLEKGEDEFILVKIPESKTVLVECELLEKIVRQCSRRSLTLYNHCRGVHEKQSMKKIKESIGLSGKTKNNNHIIKEMFAELASLGVEVRNANKK